jgi:hypothetical protein
MKCLLTAYIDRSPEGVVTYMHPLVRKNPEKVAFDLSRIRRLMTDEWHVEDILAIDKRGDELKNGDRVVLFLVKIRTTPNFPGSPELGSDIRQYRWSLVQIGGKGPWYHFGGGF